ncbi:MAG: hypothetical protein HOP13_11485 [Alphaproteobacteria bacterium]|nr:hypothetical protein [Alphaproteobacteria bacterium]
MADWHLAELEEALSKRGWRIVARLDGDNYRISASWQLERGNDPRKILIDFDGLDDLRTLPIEQSYACQQRGTKNSLYFYRKGVHWTGKLSQFVDGLEPSA